MMVGYPPFFDESPFRIYEKILEGKLQFPKWMDARAKDLIKGLLTLDHTKRIGTLKRGVQDILRCGPTTARRQASRYVVTTRSCCTSRSRHLSRY